MATVFVVDASQDHSVVGTLNIPERVDDIEMTDLTEEGQVIIHHIPVQSVPVGDMFADVIVVPDTDLASKVLDITLLDIMER